MSAPETTSRPSCAFPRWTGAGPEPQRGGSGPEAELERLQLVAHRGGQRVADLVEPLLDQRDLGLPLLEVDGQRGVDVGRVGVQPVQVELVGRPARGRSRSRSRPRCPPGARSSTSAPGCSRRSPGHRKPLVLAAAEPVDVEDPRQLGRRPRPCPRRSSAGSSRRRCSRGRAAWPSGRGARCRPCPAAAAVVSLDSVAPMNVPCCQSRASVTSGTVPARRPPKTIAEIGTPCGSSHSGASTGHCDERGGVAGVGVRGLLVRVRGPVRRRSTR